ncbi:DUF4870 domain-containing protein [Virgibacillus doumboii]|uniref:DUF4870 domain-containing protein n=1 Tax=Virgibacillus doumboii TaxID=2697503 RepID=UPI0013DF03CF|nr:hypothetical protein [Virgibacillus doumboii]
MTEEVKVDGTTEAVQEESADVKNNKGMAILAYIIFFIPLITAKESEFAMYHANQGLVLFLFGVSVSIVGTIVPIIGWLLILPLGMLCWFVFLVLGIINASNGKQKPLPMIGKVSILK